MLEAREYQRENRMRPRWTATNVLLTINVAVWVLQLWIYRSHPHFQIDELFGLSLHGLRHGFIWQLLTFQFMHAVPTPWHLLLNSWAIFVFGRAVETTIGVRRFLQVYFLSGIAGGVVQILIAWFFPNFMGDEPVVGASAGACGLIASFAVLYPNQQLTMLLFFVLPVRMRAMTLLWFLAAIGVFGLIQPSIQPYLPRSLGFVDDFFDHVAHAAHLGGLAMGFFFARQLIRVYRKRVPPVIDHTAKTSLNITPAPD